MGRGEDQYIHRFVLKTAEKRAFGRAIHRWE
jgi:hypothetical protein